jgi:threonine dehydrogenase-like Zn-dependent dehydrogenase
MKVIAITPGKGDPHIVEVEEPAIRFDDKVKLEVIEVGICGTDREVKIICMTAIKSRLDISNLFSTMKNP